jgi:succinate-semialdehyde dehydrogenase/glutarate-semialdehyde dehydrogenase
VEEHQDSGTIEVCDPATGELVARLQATSADDVVALVARSRTAWRSWQRTPASDRAAMVHRAASALEQHADELARLQTSEMGKPIGDSGGGVAAGISTMRQYAELGPLHRGKALHGAWGATDFAVQAPRGVAAVITPWNDPVAIACQGVAANLVVGNTVVCKPSERAPLAVLRALELVAAELPEDVLTWCIGGPGVGAALVSADGVDVVVHTGSAATGREIAMTCARLGRKAVLELGGNDPLIVDAGVDPRWAAGQAALGAFANAGQICVAVERIYVHRAVAEPFLAALVERAESMVVGNGMSPPTELGPLVDRRQVCDVDAQVQEARRAGARVLTGGAPVDGPGCFYPPTVLADVDHSMAVMTTETFGPVAPVMVVDSFSQALDLAAETGYGLAATVLTNDMAHAQEAWRSLEAGTVKINAVFGGAPGGSGEPRGVSGAGHGYGPELLDELTTTRVVHLEPAGGS